MKLVLAIEGMDGSGKSSLAQCVRRLCLESGQPCTTVGRRAVHATPAVGKLTRLIQEEAGNLAGPTAVLVRLAREYQRARLAAEVPAGVVLLDRFVVSILALARVTNQPVDLFVPLCRDIVRRARLDATIFVRCPLEVCRGRVEARLEPGQLPRTTDPGLLRELAGAMAAEFESGMLTGARWPVDNDGPLEAAEEQLAGYLRPCLGAT
jgi:thymidylate kinase